jgi:hypothetical protein
LAALGCGAALGIGIAAVQLVPTFQLSQLSVASQRSQSYVSGGDCGFKPGVANCAQLPPPLYKLPINFAFLYWLERYLLWTAISVATALLAIGGVVLDGPAMRRRFRLR